MPRSYIEGSVNISKLYLTEIPEFLDGIEINGNFRCQRNRLTSLEFSPDIIKGDFICHNNKITSLEHGPTMVVEGYNIGSNLLTSLEFAPTSIEEGYFNCYNNRLTTLEGGPTIVGIGFNCAHNRLTSLKGAPTRIKRGYFDCSFNKNLISLEGIPEYIRGDFYYSAGKDRVFTEKEIRDKSYIGGTVLRIG